jgi:hypothetical protein
MNPDEAGTKGREASDQAEGAVTKIAEAQAEQARWAALAARFRAIALAIFAAMTLVAMAVLGVVVVQRGEDLDDRDDTILILGAEIQSLRAEIDTLLVGAECRASFSSAVAVATADALLYVLTPSEERDPAALDAIAARLHDTRRQLEEARRTGRCGL